MDATLAEIMRLMSTQRRGRGWKVPVRLKQLIVKWARAQRQHDRSWIEIAAAVTVRSSVVARWVTAAPASKRTLKGQRLPELQRKSLPHVGMRRAHRIDGDALALRPVIVGDAANHRVIVQRREMRHTVMIAQGLDVDELVALMRGLVAGAAC